MGVWTFPLPPRPPEDELSTDYTLTCGMAQTLTKEARQILFAEEKRVMYQEITKAAREGKYSLEYKYSENINNTDIEEYAKELENQGFKVERDIICDRLIISWYSEG